MLCSTCQTKMTVNVPGSCRKCNALTTHFAYALCASCSQQLQECEWCRTPLNGTPSTKPVTSGSTPYFTTLRDADDGTTAKNIHVGEQVHVTLGEDQYAWKEWDVANYNRSCLRQLSKGNFVPDPQNPQYGTRTFVFEVIGTGQFDLEFHEVRRTWSWWYGSSSSTTPIPGGKKWKATIQIT